MKRKPSNRAIEYVKNIQGNPWKEPLTFLPPNHMSGEDCREKIALAMEDYLGEELEFIADVTTCPWTRTMILTLLKGETTEDLERQLSNEKTDRKTKRR
jgi:hypothetical protein